MTEASVDLRVRDRAAGSAPDPTRRRAAGQRARRPVRLDRGGRVRVVLARTEARSSLWWESPARARPSPRRRCWGCCRRRRTATGSVQLTDDPVGAPAHEQPNLLASDHRGDPWAGVRGRLAAMVFQEPQTALNPVKTVGWQLREALRAHRRIGRRPARERAVELLTAGRHPRARAAGRRLPAPALRRPEAAGGDRARAGERPGAADRRRADHRARRQRAGRDPRSCWASCGSGSAWRCC